MVIVSAIVTHEMSLAKDLGLIGIGAIAAFLGNETDNSSSKTDSDEVKYNNSLFCFFKGRHTLCQNSK